MIDTPDEEFMYIRHFEVKTRFDYVDACAVHLPMRGVRNPKQRVDFRNVNFTVFSQNYLSMRQ